MNVSLPLAERYARLRADRPHLRTRDAAEALGVSELDLVLLDPRTRRLRKDPQALMRGLATVGRAMALTRNAACVHERHGVWSKPAFPDAGRMGLVLGADIDLRLFLSRWSHLVHAEVDNTRGPLRSFQVFDAHGAAVHKVFAGPQTDTAAWEVLLESLIDASPEVVVLTAAAATPQDPDDATIDRDALRTAWSALRDTHDFHALLGQHRVGRVQALRLAGAPWAREVDRRGAVEAVLTGAAQDGQAIMVFVGNAGCIQIHTGPVQRVEWRGPWLNVLDPDFNLHLDTAAVASAWAVRKPTSDGPVHSLELYAEDGQLIAQLFGARKPGQAEDPAWTTRIEALTV